MKTHPQHVLKEHPGYTWVFDKNIKQYILEWKPIPGVYSPPLLEKPMRVRSLPVTEHVENLISIILGRKGLKKITERSKTRYLCFHEGQFEIWGPSERELGVAVALLQHRIRSFLA